MIGANQYAVTWSHFDSLHANRNAEFEKLCRSLFKRILCKAGTILHSDPNHPGIEVEPVLAQDGQTNISFQAKYFDNTIKYKEIKKSVNEIVSHYAGVLDVLYLYCNKDIKKACGSYKEIEGKLTSAGIKLVLVTGQTILDQAMDFPSVLSCYFGLDSLDDNWFQRNINLALENLGRRYNSLFNVETEAQKNISLLLQEDNGIAEVNRKKNDLIDELKNLSWGCGGKYEEKIHTLIEWARSLPDVDKKSFSNALNWKTLFQDECNGIFMELKERMDEIQLELENDSYESPEYANLRNERFLLDRLLSVTSCLEFSKAETTMINCRVAIITGEMGTGKTQLLATAAKRMVENGRPALLLLGQTFISDESIETQIMHNLEGLSPEQNFESLVSAMSEKGGLLDEDAVIFIDAINESNNRNIWKDGINRIIATIERYGHVKLVISLRSRFEQLTLSQAVLDKLEIGDIAKVEHRGFVDESPAKIYEFLSYYEIPFSPEYYLRSEMTNPLFLTWFCSTYNGEERGLFAIINNVLEQADQEGSKNAGHTEPTKMLTPLLYEMLDVSATGVVTKQELLSLPVWDTYGVDKKIEYLNAIERAGVLTTLVLNQMENYKIGYNLLEEYLKAERIVSREQSKEKIEEYCEKILLGIDDRGNIKNYGNEFVFAIVASLYAIKYGEELIGLIDKVQDDWHKNSLLDVYCYSFIWRSSYITYDSFFDLINKYPFDRKRIWEVFVENSVKEKSELNALGLTKLLNQYNMNRRDFLWTIVINDYDENDRIVSLAYYIEAGNTLDGLSENKAYLLSITYAWMLSSSNRVLRDRVSKTMVEILKDHFSVCKQLLELFQDVNDPYILQRLYGVVFGAVMKRKDKSKSTYKDLAQWIFKRIFQSEMVYPDILLRDYARLIIERFAVEFPKDLEEIQLEKIKPPYKSDPIPIVEEVDYGADQYRDSGLWPLLSSMKFDLDVKGVGMYGDFGRYVFQTALGYFVDLDMANIYYYALQFILNDLGYHPEWFGEYDKYKDGHGRYDVKRVERIGKKYQWIAMYNILARVSDTHNIKSWDWGNEIGYAYEGPWEPYVRDFDPTMNTKILANNIVPQICVPKYGMKSFCDTNSTRIDVGEWILEDDKMFQDFPARFTHTDKMEREWVSLFIHQENRLHSEIEQDYLHGFPRGEQLIWSDATMYILPKTDVKYKEQDLIDAGFIRRSSNGMRSCYALFSREYAWSSGYKSEFDKFTDEDDETGINAFPAAVNFLWEEEYDASQEETTSYAIPAGEIIQEMQLYEKDVDGVYYKDEEVVAFDLSLVGNKWTESVIRKDVLDEYIAKTGAQVAWTVIGEKQFFMGDSNQMWKRREGYFIYDKNEIVGSIHLGSDI